MDSGWVFYRKPGANYHASTSLQDSMCLGKEHRLILHVLGAFDAR